jgi:demethylmenaquinone methyltransferase/2-methoxy-6-polyprenyl-1,4-benzoquinol methylase
LKIPTPEHERTTGARPLGATTEQSAAQKVQQMFDTIAPTESVRTLMLVAGLQQ